MKRFIDSKEIVEAIMGAVSAIAFGIVLILTLLVLIH